MFHRNLEHMPRWHLATHRHHLSIAPVHHPSRTAIMTALFNFEALLLVIILSICTSAYVHDVFPRILDSNKNG
ncbi:hypothetical protein S40288_02665 [Stachybotrys chartarum IBT 40288]|nr:hypothetical protein S40288_02665 [Stachybotrys chartarum IBT 40288]